MTHPLRCRCGAVRASLELPTRTSRVACYCHSCQAFAHYLQCEREVLDAHGGSDIVQARPAALRFEQGADQIACLRLTAKGTMRWYAKCCRTPIGNSVASPKVSFIGLIHPFVTGSREARDATFGPVAARVHTDGAYGEPRPTQSGVPAAIARMAMIILGARISGAWRRTPFFRDDLKTPVATPHVLTAAEHAEVMGRVRRGG